MNSTSPLSGRALAHPSKRWEITLAVVAGLGLSAAISIFAWQHLLSTIALLMLPAIMNWLHWRWWPFAVAHAYFIAGNVELPEMISRFFDPAPSIVTLWGVPLLLSFIQSAPFLLYRADRPPVERALRMMGALALLTLPGVGWVAWHNPLFVAGTLYPQQGLLGVLATVGLFAVVAGGGPKFKVRSKANLKEQRVITFSCLLAFGFSIWALYQDVQHPARRAMAGWYEVDTRFIPGHQRGLNDPIPGAELAYMANYIMEFPGVDVIVFPESVLAPMAPADELELMLVADRAQKQGVVLLMGETIALKPDGSAWRNTVTAMGYEQGNRPCDRGANEIPCLLGDERIGNTIDESRLPMPMGGWRLSGGVPSRPFASDIVALETRDGTVNMAMSICFEDLMLWPHRGLLTGQADVLVSVANTWATSGTRGDQSQTLSVRLLARLAGVPLVRAVNRLPEEH